MSSEQQKAAAPVHARGLDEMCSGRRTWWARLTTYPCWQVGWATRRQARANASRFLAGLR
ncbi:hypothetical protein ACWEOS_23260 [Micromonospora taraxaci]|uniref:hypothetical protein n=1 Tax=Micromonospora taraxaci TaxID=1316803 RepID=UPI003C2AECFD